MQAAKRAARLRRQQLLRREVEEGRLQRQGLQGQACACAGNEMLAGHGPVAGAGRTAAVLVHRQCVGRVLPVGSLCRLLHVLCLCVQLEGFSVGEEDCGMMGGNCGQRLFSTRPTRVSAVSH